MFIQRNTFSKHLLKVDEPLYKVYHDSTLFGDGTKSSPLRVIGGGGSSLPDQSGNTGKYLTTNGVSASWATLTIPSGIVTTSDVGTVTNTMLANSSFTINGTSYALGSTFNTTTSSSITINAATTTIDLTKDIFNITLSINTTITLNSFRVGVFVFKITQGTGGSKVITWPASVKWPGNIPPVLSTAAGKIDIITLVYDGSDYYGTYALNY